MKQHLQAFTISYQNQTPQNKIFKTTLNSYYILTLFSNNIYESLVIPWSLHAVHANEKWMANTGTQGCYLCHYSLLWVVTENIYFLSYTVYFCSTGTSISLMKKWLIEVKVQMVQFNFRDCSHGYYLELWAEWMNYKKA